MSVWLDAANAGSYKPEPVLRIEYQGIEAVRVLVEREAA